MDATRLWRLEGALQSYAWGSTTVLPDLLGREPDGEPQAELWLGAHPRGPARVIDEDGGSLGLDAWIRDDPERVLGPRVVERFGAQLPFLLKVLAVAEPLSIQAHPSPEQARAGFARENAAGIPTDAPQRCYRDASAKPELICALTPFRALRGFRAPEEIARGIEALGVPGLEAPVGTLRGSDVERSLEAFFGGWMEMPAAQRTTLVARVAQAAGSRAASDAACAEVARLQRAYPGDPGVLAPLLLNLVELAPGEAMFLPAGELHCYLEGTGVELMANSDNVLRGGLTPKHVDVPELLATLRFRSGEVERLAPRADGDGEARYATPAAEFALSALRLAPGRAWSAAPTRGIDLLLCTEGRVLARCAAGELELTRGRAAVAPAAAGAYALEAQGGEGVVFRAGVGAGG